MKKFISLALALMLVMSLSVTAFAADNSTDLTDDKKTDTITVKGTYNGGDTTGDTIKVNVSWDAMTFTYSTAGQKWNAEKHTYENVGTTGWSNETATITVTNHSPFAVTANFEFKLADGLTGIDGKFDGETTKTLEVESANQEKYQKAETVNGKDVYPAPSQSTEFGISGGAIAENKDLGTITVTIAKKN